MFALLDALRPKKGFSNQVHIQFLKGEKKTLSRLTPAFKGQVCCSFRFPLFLGDRWAVCNVDCSVPWKLEHISIIIKDLPEQEAGSTGLPSSGQLIKKLWYTKVVSSIAGNTYTNSNLSVYHILWFKRFYHGVLRWVLIAVIVNTVEIFLPFTSNYHLQK